MSYTSEENYIEVLTDDLGREGWTLDVFGTEVDTFVIESGGGWVLGS